MSSARLARPVRRCALPLLALAALACHHEAPALAVPMPPVEGADPDIVQAVTAARAEVLRDPGSSEAWGKLGDRCFVHEFLDEAAQCYARAEELDPARYVWAYRLGWCLLNNHPEQALAPLERSLRSLDDHAPAHEVYAHVLVRLGRTDEAIAHLARASQLDPRSPHAETELGLIWLARGDLGRARAHLEAALARDERHVEAHVGLAQVLLALGLEKEAKVHSDLSRTLPQANPRRDPFASPGVTPAGARARTQLGKQLERQGRREEAAEQYRIVLRTNPAHYAARLSLAKILAKQGRRDEAVELLREAERSNPDFEQIHEDLEKLLEAPEELEENASGDE